MQKSTGQARQARKAVAGLMIAGLGGAFYGCVLGGLYGGLCAGTAGLMFGAFYGVADGIIAAILWVIIGGRVGALLAGFIAGLAGMLQAWRLPMLIIAVIGFEQGRHVLLAIPPALGLLAGWFLYRDIEKRTDQFLFTRLIAETAPFSRFSRVPLVVRLLSAAIFAALAVSLIQPRFR